MSGHPFAVSALLWLADQDKEVGAVALARAIGLYDRGGSRVAEHLHDHGLVSVNRATRNVADKTPYLIALNAVGRAVVPHLRAAMEAYKKHGTPSRASSG